LKIKCIRPNINDKLLAYVEKNMDEKENKKISRHVQECSVCSQETSQLRQIIDTLKIHKSVLAEEPAESTCISTGLLVDYTDPEKDLPASVIETIENHLASCPACKKEYENLLLLRNYVKQQKEIKEIMYSSIAAKMKLNKQLYELG